MICKIADRLKELGMAQGKLAELTGIHFTSMSQYVNGKHTPGYTTMLKIADALKTTPDKLWVAEND